MLVINTELITALVSLMMTLRGPDSYETPLPAAQNVCTGEINELEIKMESCGRPALVSA